MLGFLAPTAKKCLLGLNPKQRDKTSLDSGVEAYMGEAGWPAKPTTSQKAQPLGTLAQRGGIVALYGSGCCSVAPAT